MGADPINTSGASNYPSRDPFKIGAGGFEVGVWFGLGFGGSIGNGLGAGGWI